MDEAYSFPLAVTFSFEILYVVSGISNLSRREYLLFAVPAKSTNEYLKRSLLLSRTHCILYLSKMKNMCNCIKDLERFLNQ